MRLQKHREEINNKRPKTAPVERKKEWNDFERVLQRETSAWETEYSRTYKEIDKNEYEKRSASRCFVPRSELSIK